MSRTLSDAHQREDRIRVSIVRGLGTDWHEEVEFRSIIQRGGQIPEWDQARVGATIRWLWCIGQIERRVTDDSRVQWRAHRDPRPLHAPKTDATADLNRAAAAAAAAERQAFEAVAASGRYVNPDYAQLRALIRTTVLEVLAELDDDDTSTTHVTLERTPSP